MITPDGRFFVDGQDAFALCGVYVIDGGYNELVALPPLKAVKSNDWQEEDGIEPDLVEAPVLNTRDVTIKFAVDGERGSYYDFEQLLDDAAYHDMSFPEIGRTFRLRVVSWGNVDLVGRVGFLSVKFADDFPLRGYDYQPPTGGGLAECTEYAIDDRPVSDYGIRFLSGTMDEILKGGTVKPALLRNIPSASGADYDAGAEVRYKAKDVKFPCLLRAKNVEEMWRNYHALLHDLTQPGERTLFVEALGVLFPFIYKSVSVSDFCPSGRIWLQFSLTLTFTQGPRYREVALLATEATDDDEIVVTEENEETGIAIDI